MMTQYVVANLINIDSTHKISFKVFTSVKYRIK